MSRLDAVVVRRRRLVLLAWLLLVVVGFVGGSGVFDRLSEVGPRTAAAGRTAARS